MLAIIFIPVIFISFIIAVFLVIRAKNLAERIIAVNAIGSKFVIFFLFLGIYFNELELVIDIAIFYSLVNFVSTIAFLKFSKDE